jgi:serine protease inhibitor
MELGPALLERFSGDVVLSPYSLARALDIVRAGASGRTREALDELLGPPTPELAGLELAQAAWLAADYRPGPALTLHTGPLDPAVVNAWAREKTHGMIPSIVDRFDADEKFAITDAIFFEGKWQHPFEVVGTRAFEGAGECTMMSVTSDFAHADGAVRLPYGHGDLEFVAMLGETFRGDLQWRHGEGTVELPRFSAEFKAELREALVALGLGPAFLPGDDLEQLFTGPGSKALSRILQRARADVDEFGTKAAAVTAVIARAVSFRVEPPPFHIVFDRPFTWAIEHAPSGLQLFVGRVLNPRERG